MLPLTLPQYFLPLQNTTRWVTLIYQPMVLGAAQVRFTDNKAGSGQHAISHDWLLSAVASSHWREQSTAADVQGGGP